MCYMTREMMWGSEDNLWNQFSFVAGMELGSPDLQDPVTHRIYILWVDLELPVQGRVIVNCFSASDCR